MGELLVGFTGLPLDVRERVVERGRETTEVSAAGAGGSLLRLAGHIGLESLDLILAHAHRTDRETDATLGAVNLDDASLDLLADLERVTNLVDALVADLGDVNETVDAILELDERAERRDLRNLALDDHSDGILRGDLAPRIGLGLLEAEADALLLRVDVEHDGIDLFALLEALRRMVDLARPAHVADVGAVHPVSIVVHSCYKGDREESERLCRQLC